MHEEEDERENKRPDKRLAERELVSLSLCLSTVGKEVTLALSNSDKPSREDKRPRRNRILD